MSSKRRNKPRANQARPAGIQVLQWLRWADQDYIAARALLLDSFVLQGVILANTAIEKYLKAALTARKAIFGNTHDIASLYSSLKVTGTAPQLSRDFLILLGKAYRLRYPDSIEPGFNLSLPLTKILVEVDYTVHSLRSGLHFQSSGGEPVYTSLDNLRDHGSRLKDRNVAFGKYSREKAFAVQSACYEIRAMPDGAILEATYMSSGIKDDAVFNTEGLVPQNSRSSSSAPPIAP